MKFYRFSTARLLDARECSRINLGIRLLLLASICCSYACAGKSDVFSSPTVGFKVSKPAGWHYVTAEQNLENLKALKLNDEELQAAMQKYATAPLVAMTKFLEPYDDVNPSFKVNIKPYGQLKGKSPGELLSLILPQIERAFKDFDIVQPPTDVEVSGIQSAYARINYTMQVPDGRSFPTTSELWIVPRGGYFFLLGAGTRQDEKTGSRKEIEAILATVKIDR